MAPGRFIYAVVLATMLALCLVRQNAALRTVGYRLEDLREEIAEEEAERAIYLAHVSKLRNPQRILSLVAWLGLDLCERPAVQTAQADPSRPEHRAESSLSAVP